VACSWGGANVIYGLFTDVAARDAALASLLGEAPAPDDGAASCREGAYRGEVTERHRAWSIACWVSSSGQVLLWSEPDEPVLGAILAPAGADAMATWEVVRLPG
jgi:hypothetical protein